MTSVENSFFRGFTTYNPNEDTHLQLDSSGKGKTTREFTDRFYIVDKKGNMSSAFPINLKIPQGSRFIIHNGVPYFEGKSKIDLSEDTQRTFFQTLPPEINDQISSKLPLTLFQ